MRKNVKENVKLCLKISLVVIAVLLVIKITFYFLMPNHIRINNIKFSVAKITNVSYCTVYDINYDSNIVRERVKKCNPNIEFKINNKIIKTRIGGYDYNKNIEINHISGLYFKGSKILIIYDKTNVTSVDDIPSTIIALIILVPIIIASGLLLIEFTIKLQKKGRNKDNKM